MVNRAAAVLLLAALGCAPAPVEETAGSGPLWRHAASPSDLPRGRALRAGFLVVDGVYNSELIAPYDIFHHTPFHTEPDPGIEVFTVSPTGEPVLTFEGLTLIPHYAFGEHPEIDILVVPSAEGSMGADLEDERMLEWVRAVGGKARYVVSLCDGAFVLAAAGLLDGHKCTTFPGDQDGFAATFPELELIRGVSFVHDGRILTSEGGAKSYDVAMHLVDHIYGEHVATGVGRGLIIAWPPAELAALVVE